MTLEIFIPDPSLLFSYQIDEFVRMYGRRAYSLTKLSAMGNDNGFFVPQFGILPIAFFHEINMQFGINVTRGGGDNFLSCNMSRLAHCQSAISGCIDKFVDFALQIDRNGKPIIRGTSSEEEYNGLSFAGVCHSAIPKRHHSVAENITNGISKVIAGSFSPYANYYFLHHGIPERGRDVALIFMEMINDPVVHATAHVYDSEVNIRYFVDPSLGDINYGGHEVAVCLNRNIRSQLLKEPGFIIDELEKTVNVLVNLYHNFYSSKTALDIEFIIAKECANYQLNIVQIRPISAPHLINYEQSSYGDLGVANINCFCVPSLHILHSVGIISGTIVKLNCDSNPEVIEGALNEYSDPIFVISHNLGQGSFLFLSSIPLICKKRLSVLIMHPKLRNHDHLQYSIFEDKRLGFVMHCQDELNNWISDKEKVEISSTGKNAIIKRKG